MGDWLTYLQGIATLLAAAAAAIMTFLNYLRQGETQQEVHHLIEVEEQRMRQLQGLPSSGSAQAAERPASPTDLPYPRPEFPEFPEFPERS